MIVLQHNWNRVTAITYNEENLPVEKSTPITQHILSLAKAYPDELLVWCHECAVPYLNTEEIQALFSHRRMMHTYGFDHYLPEAIGFVEDSPFININRTVQYPTWRMHGLVGAVYAEILLLSEPFVQPEKDFCYYLNSVAKLLMPKGLFCYSSPQLLLNHNWSIACPVASYTKLFRFVKQHYKARWTVFLLVCFVLYHKQLPLWPFITAFWYKKRNVPSGILRAIAWQSQQMDTTAFNIDVVIPTIGRKPYLYDVLKDLAQQTLLPQKVIVIEQNPDKDSESELDYLYHEEWPFEIKHLFVHQTGACNARNLGLKEVTAEWVFLADDDVCIKQTFLEEAIKNINKIKSKATTFACLLKGEKSIYPSVFQWSTFGSGCSIVASKYLGSIQFNLSYEHGYGEDADFGMQLRNAGVDVVYVPSPRILHLKAPVGGFRTKPSFPWDDEIIQPKPSPTVLLFRLLHYSNQQLMGYKWLLFLKYYPKQSIRNPLKYARNFKAAWAVSLKWAKRLKSTNQC